MKAFVFIVFFPGLLGVLTSMAGIGWFDGPTGIATNLLGCLISNIFYHTV